MSETRTETYAHDCGCELCADHHEDAVRRATPARAEGADAMSDEECAALFDTLAAIRVDRIGYDACHESFVRAARALRRRATPAPEVTVSEAVVAPLIEALHGMGYPAIRHADARRALAAALRGGAR